MNVTLHKNAYDCLKEDQFLNSCWKIDQLAPKILFLTVGLDSTESYYKEEGKLEFKNNVN